MAVANPWLSLTLNAMTLGFEAQTVVGLRVMKAAMGGKAAERENERMVSEKISAVMDIQAEMLSSMLRGDPHGGAERAVAIAQRTVSANRRRLSSGG